MSEALPFHSFGLSNSFRKLLFLRQRTRVLRQESRKLSPRNGLTSPRRRPNSLRSRPQDWISDGNVVTAGPYFEVVGGTNERKGTRVAKISGAMESLSGRCVASERRKKTWLRLPLTQPAVL
jgi:hypothetical protein